MTTRLLIARHGNTFGPGDVVRRVGAGTDLPLVERGREQGAELGRYLQGTQRVPDVVYCGVLQRAKQTAACALSVWEEDIELLEDAMFNEIDYGPDEGKPEDEVIARLGESALRAWDESAQVPQGWRVSPDELVSQWLVFGKRVAEQHVNQTVLVVTSNGVARFAPHLTGEFEAFKSKHGLKLSTGAVGCLSLLSSGVWRVDSWNERPHKWLAAQAS